MESLPSWAEHLIELMDQFLELQSPGTLEWFWNEREEQLLFAPGTVELLGGAEDGEEVYPFLVVHLAELAQEFDVPPSLEWHTMHDEVWVAGMIQGQDAFVIIRKEPFASIPEKSAGWYRRRKPTFDDSDDDEDC